MDWEREEPFHPISCGLYCFFLWILSAVIRCSSTGTEPSFGYQEKWLIHRPILKCTASHFKLSDIEVETAKKKKIDSGTKQPHSRARPRKRIPQRILAVFHSNHGVVCLWIIQNALNQWNGLKPLWLSWRLLSVRHTVNFHKYLSFVLIKTGALILLFHAALHHLRSTQQSHIEDCCFSLLLCYRYKQGVHVCVFPAS